MPPRWWTDLGSAQAGSAVGTKLMAPYIGFVASDGSTATQTAAALKSSDSDLDYKTAGSRSQGPLGIHAGNGLYPHVARCQGAQSMPHRTTNRRSKMSTFTKSLVLLAAAMPLASTASAQNVLIYSEKNTFAEEAALAAGYTVWASADEAAAEAEYNADPSAYDLVVLATPTSGMTAGLIGIAMDRAAAGEPLIYGWWNLDSDVALQGALGVSTSEISTPPELYSYDGAAVNFFDGTADPITTATDAWSDNGDDLTPTAGGWLAAGNGSPTGPGSIAVTNGDSTIVNGFMCDDYLVSDGDGDGIMDMVELYGNEMAFLLESGPTLAISGAGCPGPMLFTVTGASGGGPVAILSANGTGSAAVPGGPCVGTPTGLAGAGLALRAIVTADPLGNASLSPSIPGGACGAVVQVLDVASCTVSNTSGF
jgi:hypothetical protein